LNGGELNGVRLLKPSTVAMMRTNRLNDQTLNSNSGIGPVHITPAQGFGYDFAVIKDPARAKTPVGNGSYLWWGIAGTWFWIDPTNDVVFVGMIQRSGGAPGAVNHEDVSKNGVYQALTHPEL
jgi:CubicO group peptidase (beta-lactamase class C family)